MATEEERVTVKASVLVGPRDLQVQERQLPSLGPNDVRIAIKSTGICGSDLHYYNHYRNGDILVREPLTLGHESAGVVTALGSKVARSRPDLKLGDAVVMEVGEPCGGCELCLEGRYNICREMRFRSSAKAFPHAQGTLQEEIVIHEKYCERVNPNLAQSGALVEPLAVALHAADRVALPLGNKKKPLTILVLGAGVVGLLCAAKCRDLYDALVVIADTNEDRTKWAVEHGFADHYIVVPMRPREVETVEAKLSFANEVAGSIKGTQWPDDVRTPAAWKEVKPESVGEVDSTFECTGAESCLQTAIYATKPGGKVVLIGMGNPVQTLPISAAALREVDLVGSFRYANNYKKAASELAGLGSSPGVSINFEPLITHRFKGIESIAEAFAMAARLKDDDGKMVLKVVIDF
ncbi:chaperonin 10-like protein [Cladorrhinum sp. PSN332]|nr:chaperonin 10-like protein [Cladorrhinum sp. PSN332]